VIYNGTQPENLKKKIPWFPGEGDRERDPRPKSWAALVQFFLVIFQSEEG